MSGTKLTAKKRPYQKITLIAKKMIKRTHTSTNLSVKNQRAK